MKFSIKSNSKAFSLIELSIVILIIGILVTGIVSGSRLVGQMKLQSARSLTKSSPVNSIKDLVLWIETTSEESFDTEYGDGDQVSQINDIGLKTTSKNHFIQSVAGKRPLYKKNNFNGLPSLSFDGIDDEMLTIRNIPVSEFTQSGKNTIIMVAKYYSGVVIFKYEDIGDAIPRVGIEVNGVNIRYDYPTGYQVLTGSSNVVNRMLIITADANKINQTIYLNGVQEATRANNVDMGNAGFSAPISLSSNNNNLFVKSDIAELLLYDRALTLEERKSIEEYLSKKWGIKLN